METLRQRGNVAAARGCGWNLSGSHCSRSRFSGKLGQGLVKGVAVDQPVAHRQHHLLELWHAGLGGLNVNGLEVKEAARHRKSNDVATQHPRTLLVPQREVFGNVLVLVDARFDLHWAVHQLLLRQLIEDQFSKLLTIASSRHPADQVVLASWAKRQNQQ